MLIIPYMLRYDPIPTQHKPNLNSSFVGSCEWPFGTVINTLPLDVVKKKKAGCVIQAQIWLKSSERTIPMHVLQ